MATETALVTGASAGIGLELARLFATDGCDLVLIARRAAKLDELAGELRTAHGVNVRVIAADLARPQAPHEIRLELDSAGIDVDVVVNNAGCGDVGPIAEIDTNRQLDVIQVNCSALTALTRLFLPAMIERGRGGILNVGSTAAFQSGPTMAVYYATKAYVLSFTDALYDEVRGTGVKVSCLCPGPTVTEFGELSGMKTSRLFSLGTMPADQVARAGYRGLSCGKPIVIPGLLNKFGAGSTRFCPRWFTRKFVRWLQAGAEKELPE